jgi:hypothetical protein
LDNEFLVVAPDDPSPEAIQLIRSDYRDEFVDEREPRFVRPAAELLLAVFEVGHVEVRNASALEGPLPCSGELEPGAHVRKVTPDPE